MTETNATPPLIAQINALENAKVLTLGDVMLDRYVSGTVDRISPEAPIAVLRIENERAMLGGAGNVAANVSALGGGGTFVAVIGEDGAGREVDQLLGALPIISANLVVSDTHPTTVKTRYVGAGQQLMRADMESPNAMDDTIQTALSTNFSAAFDGHGALVLSDYGKGVLSDGLIIDAIDKAKQANIPVIVDPKGLDYRRYKGADLITPNKKELAQATNMPTDTDAEVIAACHYLIDHCGVGGILATRSAEGMTLVRMGHDPVHLKAEALEVFDVSGAGDTVVATLSLGLAAGLDWVDAASLANTAAGIVVAKSGTATLNSIELLSALHHQDLEHAEAKSVSVDHALSAVARWRTQGKRVAFTNGCFDLLHPGHISLLSQSKRAGDKLVVGLNSDASVKRLKGDTRPVQSEAARAAVLGALSAVDLVVIFSEDTPLDLIKALQPDVLVKGADYTIDTVVGADIVQAYGGKIVLAELMDGQSTTRTIERLTPKT